jgi:hypothetical protein
MSKRTIRRAPVIRFYLGEYWKPVVGFEGYYSISSRGRLKREAGKVPMFKLGVLIGVYPVQSRLLKPKRGCDGFVAMLVKPGQKRKYKFVHRLVLEAFVGACPLGMECCHNDGNNKNNNLENLRWDTAKSNKADMVKHGTCNRGERHGNHLLTVALVKRIRHLFKDGMRTEDIAIKLGFKHSTVYAAANRNSWAWLE